MRESYKNEIERGRVGGTKRERECKISQMIKEGNVSFVRIKFSFNFFLPEAFHSFVAEAEVWIWMNLMKKEKEWRN